MTILSPNSRDDSRISPTVARLRTRKETRRKREIALILLALGFVAAAVVFDEPFLILVSIFPALASYGQR